MARYYFWAKLVESNVIIDVPDAELEGLEGEDLERKLLKYHTEWSQRQINGDWELVEEAPQS